MRKIAYPIIFIVIVLLISTYIVGKEKVEAAKVTVEITKNAPFNALNESERDELIGDISLNKVHISKLQPKGSEMSMPGISVALFRNKIMISKWTSVPIKDKGIYELIVGLDQPVDRGDIISIAVYVNDDRGKVVIGKRKDAEWDKTP